MASVYGRAIATTGKVYKLEELVARHVVVQNKLERETSKLARKASATLAASRFSGDAKITTSKGRIDHYVNLDDTDGAAAAMTIEYGRRGDTVYQKGPLKGQPVPASNAVAPLRLAMGMSHAAAGTRRVKAKTTTKAAAKRLAKTKREEA